MGLITLNITVTVDAEDLIEEVGVERAARLVKCAIRDAIGPDDMALEDELGQYVCDVDVDGSLVPVAVREVKVEGLEDADEEVEDATEE